MKNEATARFEFGDDLPDGICVVLIERRGELVWLVRKGHMSEQLQEELNDVLAHIAGNGLWVQRWNSCQQRAEAPHHLQAG